MAGVTYKISGKFDKKAITDAQSGFSKLSSVIKGFGIGVGLKAATTAMSALKKVTSGAAETFLAQNKALKNFEIAVKNANLPIQEMNKLRNELSQKNFFDDNTLNNALALATNMGLAEDQIKDVMKAATDMAASGVMPLDTAVKQLGASYSGTTGQLAKLAPELKNMTKEQLENGDAVKYMTEQYKGYAQAMSNTFFGRDTQFKNTFSDLQAAVGGIMQGLKFMSQGKFLAPLQKATAWLTDNKENILKFFVALPDLAKATIGKIWDMIKYTFSGEGMKQLFTFWGNSMLVEIKLLIPTIFDLVKMLFDDILALGDFTIGNLLRIINNMLAKVGNTLIEVVNTALQKIMDNDLVKWVAKNIFKAEDFDASNVVKFRFDTKELTTFEDFKNTIADNAKNFGANFKKNLTEAIDKEKKVLDQFTGKYKEIGQELGQEIKSIMDNTELPADLKNAIETAVVDVVVEELANGQHVITVSYPINLECDFQRHTFDVYITSNGGTTVIPFNTLKATFVGQEIDEIARWDGNIRVDDESPFELVALGNVGVNEFYHGDFVISVNPEEYDPTIPNQIYIQDAIVIPTVLEHISLYAMGTLGIKPIYEGTGDHIPHVLFYSMYISTENDDTLVTENGIAFETEGMPSVAQ